MSGIKSWVLKTIPMLPNSVNRSLAILNRNPVMVYGKRYGAYRDFLRNSELKYDPVPKLLVAVNEA